MTKHDIELATEKLDSFCVKMGCQGVTANTIFEVDFTKNAMTPEQKAIMIGEVIHLDYLFFENEEPPFVWDGCDTFECLLCNCYCLGALLPIRCKVCDKADDENALEQMANKLKERVYG